MQRFVGAMDLEQMSLDVEEFMKDTLETPSPAKECDDDDDDDDSVHKLPPNGAPPCGPRNSMAASMA